MDDYGDHLLATADGAFDVAVIVELEERVAGEVP